MNRGSLKIFYVALLCFAVGACQPKESDTQNGGATHFLVHLVLPQNLSLGSAGYETLSAKATHLLFHLKSKEGLELKKTFPFGTWRELSLGGLTFPRSATDHLEIIAEIWLRDVDGLGEGVPGLRGKAQFAAADLDQNGEGRVELKLHLLLPISRLRGESDLSP